MDTFFCPPPVVDSPDRRSLDVREGRPEMCRVQSYVTLSSDQHGDAPHFRVPVLPCLTPYVPLIPSGHTPSGRSTP